MKELGERLRTRLRPGSLYRSIFVLAGGSGVAQLVPIAVAPIVTRLYTPDDFGVLAVYSAAFGILAVMSTLRFELAIPLPKNERVASQLLLLTLVTACIVAAATAAGVAIVLAVPRLAQAAAPVAPFLWLLPIGVVLYGTYQALVHWAIRRDRFGAIARTKVMQALSSAGLQLAIGVTIAGPIGLILGHLANLTAGGVALADEAARAALRRAAGTLRALPATAKAYARFPLLSGSANLLNAAVQQIPVIALTAFQGVESAGLYLLVQRIGGLPTSIISSAVSHAITGEWSRSLRSGGTRLGRQLHRLLIRMASAAALGAAAAALLAPFFTTIFGVAWTRAGDYLLLLIPFFALRFLSSSVVASLELLGRNELRLAREGMLGALMFGAAAIANALFAGDLAVVAALSIGGSVGYGATIVLVILVVRRHDAHVGRNSS